MEFPGLFLGLSACFVLGQEIHRVELKPEFLSDQQAWYSGLSRIESDGSALFLVSSGETRALTIKRLGRVVSDLGRAGSPLRVGRAGVLGISLNGKGLWVIEMELKRVRQFREGVYRDGTERLSEPWQAPRLFES